MDTDSPQSPMSIMAELDSISHGLEDAMAKSMQGLSPPKVYSSNPFSMSTYIAASDIMRSTQLTTASTSAERARVVGSARLRAKQRADTLHKAADKASDMLRQPINVPEILNSLTMRRQDGRDEHARGSNGSVVGGASAGRVGGLHAGKGAAGGRRAGADASLGIKSPGVSRTAAPTVGSNAGLQVGGGPRTPVARRSQPAGHTVQPMSPPSVHPMDDDAPPAPIRREAVASATFRRPSSSTTVAKQVSLQGKGGAQHQHAHAVSGSGRVTPEDQQEDPTRLRASGIGHSATPLIGRGGHDLNTTGEPHISTMPSPAPVYRGITTSCAQTVHESSIAGTQTSRPSSPSGLTYGGGLDIEGEAHHVDVHVDTGQEQPARAAGDRIPPIHVHISLPQEIAGGKKGGAGTGKVAPAGSSPFTSKVPVPVSLAGTAAMTSLASESAKQTLLLRSMLETQAQAFSAQIGVMKAQAEAQLEWQALAAQEKERETRQKGDSPGGVRHGRGQPVVIPIMTTPAPAPVSPDTRARVHHGRRPGRIAPIAIPITVTPMTQNTAKATPMMVSTASEGATQPVSEQVRPDATVQTMSVDTVPRPQQPSAVAMTELLATMWRDAMGVLHARDRATGQAQGPPGGPDSAAASLSDELVLTAITTAMLRQTSLTQDRSSQGGSEAMEAAVGTRMGQLEGSLRETQAGLSATSAVIRAASRASADSLAALSDDVAESRETAQYAADAARNMEVAWKAAISHLERQMALSSQTMAGELAEVRTLALAAADRASTAGVTHEEVFDLANAAIDERTAQPLLAMSDTVRGLSEQLAGAVAAVGERAEEALACATEAAEAARGAVEAIMNSNTNHGRRAPSLQLTSTGSMQPSSAAPSASSHDRLGLLGPRTPVRAFASPTSPLGLSSSASGFGPTDADLDEQVDVDEDSTASLGEVGGRKQAEVDPFLPRATQYRALQSTGTGYLVAVQEDALNNDELQDMVFDLEQLSAGEIVLAPGPLPAHGTTVKLFPLMLTTPAAAVGPLQ